MAETLPDNQSLLSQIIADELVEGEAFFETSLSKADLALFSRAGHQLALPEIKDEMLVFNQHPEIASASINSEYFVDINTGEISVNQGEIVERGFKEVQSQVEQVLGEPLVKALKISGPSVWEMFGVQMPSDDDNVLQLRCYWRLTERGTKEIKKFRNKILTLLGLEELKGNGDAILSLFDTIKDSVAFAVDVTLSQNETNAESFIRLPKEEAQRQAALASRTAAKESQMNANLRSSAKAQSTQRHATKKGKHKTIRRAVQKEKKHAETQDMIGLRELAKNRKLQSSDTDLPTVNINIANNSGENFRESLAESFNRVLTEQARDVLAKTAFSINPDSHIATTLLPEDFELLQQQIPEYLAFLGQLSADSEDIYPREFVFSELQEEDQKALEAFEQCIQFMLAQDQDWQSLVEFQQHLKTGNGLGVQQPNRPLNHTSGLSLINQDIEILIFAIERGLNRSSELGELIYQSSAQLHSAWGKIVNDNYEGVGKKTKINFCMNALKASSYDFNTLDTWRKVAMDGIQHINALQIFAGTSAKPDIAVLMRQICQYNDAKPSKNERTFIGIIADRFTGDDSFYQESCSNYIQQSKGLSGKGKTLI